jgi:chloramphenicol O-acetyltransferase type A
VITITFLRKSIRAWTAGRFPRNVPKYHDPMPPPAPGALPIDLTNWPRKPLYDLFAHFTEPYHGVCLRLDCTESFHFAKSQQISVFLTLLHRALAASQQVENLRLRIVDDAPWLFPVIHGGSAVGRPNGTIGFAYYPWLPELVPFVQQATISMEAVRARTDLERHTNQDLIRFSVLPWLDFTSIDHAREFTFRDSAPKITFGKITEANGRHTMPVSIHAHHALADGLHVAQFVDHFQSYLTNPESL